MPVVLTTVQILCDRGMLHGSLSRPSTGTHNALSNAMYTPTIYSCTQRKLVDSFYEANGYLTVDKCVAFGISRRQIEKYVKESFVSQCGSYYMFDGVYA